MKALIEKLIKIPFNSYIIPGRFPGLVLIVCIILWESQSFGGPFLKINRIDAESDFPKVNVFITVRNIDNTFIKGLDEENLILYEDGYRVNYVMVNSHSDIQGFLYLVFSIDSSKSISRQFLAGIKESAKQIVHSVAPNDKIAIFRFNDDVTLMNSFTNNRVEILKNINKIETHGKNTMLYNSIYDSIDLLSKADVTRKAVIVFTDGKDEGSSIEINDIINKISTDASVPIYFICTKSSENIKTLARISKLTGGKLIYSHRIEDVKGMYKMIMNMIKSQYVVRYQSILKPDGGTHKVEVRLKHGAIRDRAYKDINIERRFNLIRMPSLSEILLICLVLLLIGLLVFVLIYSLRKNSKIIETLSVPPEIVKVYPDYNKPPGVYERMEAANSETLVEISPDQEANERLYSRVWLMEKEGPEKWKKIPLLFEELTLGSKEGNHILIKDNSVSPTHSKIKRVKDSYYIFDLASDFGTYLNDKKLLRPKLLHDWDEIRIGNAHFIFRGTNIT